MPLIDWHSHVWQPEHFEPSQGEELTTRTGASLDAGPSVHGPAVAETADKFVVIAMCWRRLGVHVTNDYVADYVRGFGGRAAGIASVDPSDEDAPRELERAVRELGLKGVKLSPTYTGFDPLCPEAWRVYETANRLGIVIYWHMGAAYAIQSTFEHGNPIRLDPIAREFPRMRQVICHIGQPHTAETVLLMRKHDQVFADLSARFHRPWQLYNAMMLAMEYKVTDRLLFGSDFPVRPSLKAAEEFRGINEAWGEGVHLPRIPADLIEEIIMNRPFELVWPDGV